MSKEEKNKEMDIEPDFISLVSGFMAFTGSLAFFANFDIFEQGWTFFFIILIMLVLGGSILYDEIEKILEKIYS